MPESGADYQRGEMRLKHGHANGCCLWCLLAYHENRVEQIKILCISDGWALFVTYTIIQSIMRSEMCSLHLTHPSVHTWSSGQPTAQRPGSSRGLPVGAGIRSHNLGLPRGFKSNALSIRPTTAPIRPTIYFKTIFFSFSFNKLYLF